jgi:hypothetical protein
MFMSSILVAQGAGAALRLIRRARLSGKPD